MKQECYNPSAIEPKALNHWIECVKQPGCLRGILETYRAGLKNGDIHHEMLKKVSQRHLLFLHRKGGVSRRRTQEQTY